eukprot:2504-Heterococcus_DN1.PRE.1
MSLLCSARYALKFICVVCVCVALAPHALVHLEPKTVCLYPNIATRELNLNHVSFARVLIDREQNQ